MTLIVLCLNYNVKRLNSHVKGGGVPWLSSHCVLGLYCNHGGGESDGEAWRCFTHTHTTSAPGLSLLQTLLSTHNKDRIIACHFD